MINIHNVSPIADPEPEIADVPMSDVPMSGVKGIHGW
jgi:hypothetical protein